MARALDYRRQFLAADPVEITDLANGESYSAREFVVDDIRYEAFALQDKAGSELANRFIRVATAQVTPIGNLPDQWLRELTGQIAEQTRSQHRSALNGFLSWAGEEVTVEEITRKKAGDYIGQYLLVNWGSACRARCLPVGQVDVRSAPGLVRVLAETGEGSDHEVVVIGHRRRGMGVPR